MAQQLELRPELRRSLGFRELLAAIRSSAPYAGLKDETYTEVLNFIATGGYALKAYDKFRRLVRDPDGHAVQLVES